MHACEDLQTKWVKCYTYLHLNKNHSANLNLSNKKVSCYQDYVLSLCMQGLGYMLAKLSKCQLKSLVTKALEIRSWNQNKSLLQS